MEGMLRDLDADLLRNARSGLPVDLREHDHELFPPKRATTSARRVLQAESPPCLNTCPEEMTVRVVVVFELIKIQHEDGEGAAVAPSALDFCLEFSKKYRRLKSPVSSSRELSSLVRW